MKLIYSNLPEGSMMRQLMVDYYVGVDAAWFKQKGNMEDLPYDFVREALVGFAKVLSGGKPPYPPQRAKCTYHVHNGDVPKCS